MRDDRRIGISLLVLGAVIYILSGIALERSAAGSMADFKAVYFAARCLVQHIDPYRQNEFLRVYLTEGGPSAHASLQTDALRKAIAVCINLPTSLLIVTPFTLLTWPIAHLVWSTLTACSYILAAFLLWKVAAEYAPIVSGALVGFVLATSQVLFAGGNTAGVAASFGLISVWCFLCGRYQIPGVFCLAAALLLKPHDVGLIWLFFVLSGPLHRKRALQTAALVVALGLPAILWASAVTPQWPQELRSNIRAVSSRGEINDPGPASMTYRSPAMVVDLQSAIAVFRDEPSFYNPLSYGICGALGLIWVLTTLRSPASASNAWEALVPITTLTLLITYHHPYDARLLLISVPSAVMQWKKGDTIGFAALLSCIVSLVANGDIPIALLSRLDVNVPPTLIGKLEMVLIARPQPLVLLLTTVVSLAIYVRQVWGRRSEEVTLPPEPAGT